MAHPTESGLCPIERSRKNIIERMDGEETNTATVDRGIDE
jgi:hypothetical protein